MKNSTHPITVDDLTDAQFHIMNIMETQYNLMTFDRSFEAGPNGTIIAVYDAPELTLRKSVRFPLVAEPIE
jgi:hypothetical protein